MSEQVKITKQVGLGVAFQTVHTAHFQRYLTLKNVHICNTSAVDATVQVTLTTTGETPAQAHALLWDFTVPGNDFIEWGEGLMLTPGGAISALASAVDSIVLTLSGIEE